MNKKIIIISSLFLAGLLIAFSFNGGESVKESELVQVESKYVCMVNDNLFDSEQITVDVNGMRYYGCCGGCKAKLENNPSTRFAVDPVSGNSVDKATATIGADSDRNVYYFENLANLQDYNG